MSNARSKALRSARAEAVWCELCHDASLMPSQHSHHLRELAYGGHASGPQVALCANCHDLIHRALTSITKGKDDLESYEVYGQKFMAALRIALNQRRAFQKMTQEQKDALDVGGKISAEFTAAEMRQIRALKIRIGCKTLPQVVKLLIRQRLRLEGMKGLE